MTSPTHSSDQEGPFNAQSQLLCLFAAHDVFRYKDVKANCTSSFRETSLLTQHITEHHMNLCARCKTWLVVKGIRSKNKEKVYSWLKEHDCVPRDWRDGEEYRTPEAMTPGQAENWATEQWKKIQLDDVPHRPKEPYTWFRRYRSLFSDSTEYPNPYGTYTNHLIQAARISQQAHTFTPPDQLVLQEGLCHTPDTRSPISGVAPSHVELSHEQSQNDVLLAGFPADKSMLPHPYSLDYPLRQEGDRSTWGKFKPSQNGDDSGYQSDHDEDSTRQLEGREEEERHEEVHSNLGISNAVAGSALAGVALWSEYTTLGENPELLDDLFDV